VHNAAQDYECVGSLCDIVAVALLTYVRQATDSCLCYYNMLGENNKIPVV